MNTKYQLYEGPLHVGGKVDVDMGVIYGVSLATEGPALGHDCWLDRTSLIQLHDAAKQFHGGLKVKMGHEGGVGEIIGYIATDSIHSGSFGSAYKLRGNLHLFGSTKSREYVLELAQTIPDNIGLSVAFSGPNEVIDGKKFARCTEIYSCDLVNEPAANPSGLFSAKSFGSPAQQFADKAKAAYDKLPKKDRSVGQAISLAMKDDLAGYKAFRTSGINVRWGF